MRNTAGLTQVKVSVDSGIAASFKKACLAADTSMARVLSLYMASYADLSLVSKKAPDLSTRRKRRSEVQNIIHRLLRVREEEIRYRDNIPENLQGSMTYDRAELFVSLLDEAMDLLSSVE